MTPGGGTTIKDHKKLMQRQLGDDGDGSDGNCNGKPPADPPWQEHSLERGRRRRGRSKSNGSRSSTTTTMVTQKLLAGTREGWAERQHTQLRSRAESGGLHPRVLKRQDGVNPSPAKVLFMVDHAADLDPMEVTIFATKLLGHLATPATRPPMSSKEAAKPPCSQHLKWAFDLFSSKTDAMMMKKTTKKAEFEPMTPESLKAFGESFVMHRESAFLSRGLQDSRSAASFAPFSPFADSSAASSPRLFSRNTRPAATHPRQQPAYRRTEDSPRSAPHLTPASVSTTPCSSKKHSDAYEQNGYQTDASTKGSCKRANSDPGTPRQQAAHNRFGSTGADFKPWQNVINRFRQHLYGYNWGATDILRAPSNHGANSQDTASGALFLFTSIPQNTEGLELLARQAGAPSVAKALFASDTAKVCREQKIAVFLVIPSVTTKTSALVSKLHRELSSNFGGAVLSIQHIICASQAQPLATLLPKSLAGVCNLAHFPFPHASLRVQQRPVPGPERTSLPLFASCKRSSRQPQAPLFHLVSASATKPVYNRIAANTQVPREDADLSQPKDFSLMVCARISYSDILACFVKPDEEGLAAADADDDADAAADDDCVLHVQASPRICTGICHKQQSKEEQQHCTQTPRMSNSQVTPCEGFIAFSTLLFESGSSVIAEIRPLTGADEAAIEDDAGKEEGALGGQQRQFALIHSKSPVHVLFLPLTHCQSKRLGLFHRCRVSNQDARGRPSRRSTRLAQSRSNRTQRTGNCAGHDGLEQDNRGRSSLSGSNPRPEQCRFCTYADEKGRPKQPGFPRGLRIQRSFLATPFIQSAMWGWPLEASTPLTDLESVCRSSDRDASSVGSVGSVGAVHLFSSVGSRALAWEATGQAELPERDQGPEGFHGPAPCSHQHLQSSAFSAFSSSCTQQNLPTLNATAWQKRWECAVRSEGSDLSKDSSQLPSHAQRFTSVSARQNADATTNAATSTTRCASPSSSSRVDDAVTGVREGKDAMAKSHPVFSSSASRQIEQLSMDAEVAQSDNSKILSASRIDAARDHAFSDDVSIDSPDNSEASWRNTQHSFVNYAKYSAYTPEQASIAVKEQMEIISRSSKESFPSELAHFSQLVTAVLAGEARSSAEQAAIASSLVGVLVDIPSEIVERLTPKFTARYYQAQALLHILLFSACKISPSLATVLESEDAVVGKKVRNDATGESAPSADEMPAKKAGKKVPLFARRTSLRSSRYRRRRKLLGSTSQQKEQGEEEVVQNGMAGEDGQDNAQSASSRKDGKGDLTDVGKEVANQGVSNVNVADGGGENEDNGESVQQEQQPVTLHDGLVHRISNFVSSLPELVHAGAMPLSLFEEVVQESRSRSRALHLSLSDDVHDGGDDEVCRIFSRVKAQSMTDLVASPEKAPASKNSKAGPPAIDRILSTSNLRSDNASSAEPNLQALAVNPKLRRRDLSSLQDLNPTFQVAIKKPKGKKKTKATRRRKNSRRDDTGEGRERKERRSHSDRRRKSLRESASTSAVQRVLSTAEGSGEEKSAERERYRRRKREGKNQHSLTATRRLLASSTPSKGLRLSSSLNLHSSIPETPGRSASKVRPANAPNDTALGQGHSRVSLMHRFLSAGGVDDTDDEGEENEHEEDKSGRHFNDVHDRSVAFEGLAADMEIPPSPIKSVRGNAHNVDEPSVLSRTYPPSLVGIGLQRASVSQVLPLVETDSESSDGSIPDDSDGDEEEGNEDRDEDEDAYPGEVQAPLYHEDSFTQVAPYHPHHDSSSRSSIATSPRIQRQMGKTALGLFVPSVAQTEHGDCQLDPKEKSAGKRPWHHQAGSGEDGQRIAHSKVQTAPVGQATSRLLGNAFGRRGSHLLAPSVLSPERVFGDTSQDGLDENELQALKQSPTKRARRLLVHPRD